MLSLALMLALQTAPAEILAPINKIVADPVTMDINGDPEEVVSYEWALVVPGQAPSTPARTVTSVIPEIDVRPSFAGLPVGEYDVYARAIDKGGNISDWSVPLFVSVGRDVVDNVKPAAPGKPRVQ